MDFTFQARRPSPPLDAVVERLWYARGHVPYERERILPDGRAVLILNLGDPFATEHAVGKQTCRINRRAWVAGPQTGFVVNMPLGETHMLGASFRPAGARRMLGLPMIELIDRFVDLDDLWPGSVEGLRDRIAAAPDIARKFDILEATLRHCLADGADAPIVDAALPILSDAGDTRIAAVCERLDVSRKHLAAQFRHHVGVSPKTLARLDRFNRALAGLNAGNTPDLAMVAQACGYFDQPHFNRDFACFAGLSPGRYLALQRQHFGDATHSTDNARFVPLS